MLRNDSLQNKEFAAVESMHHFYMLFTIHYHHLYVTRSECNPDNPSSRNPDFLGFLLDFEMFLITFQIDKSHA